MIRNYEEFKDTLIEMLKIRSANFINTDCNINILFASVYDDICRDVILNTIKQEIIIETNKTNYMLENTLIHDINNTDSHIDYYGDYFDIVDSEYYDISNWFTQIENGEFDVDILLTQQLNKTSVYILRKNTVSIRYLTPTMYQNIFTAMMEGCMYMIQDVIPSEIDIQGANLGYQRFFKAKEILRNEYPQRPKFDGRHTGSQSKYKGL